MSFPEFKHQQAYINATETRDKGEAIVPKATIDQLAMDAIAEALNKAEYNSGTADWIAHLVRLSGREVNDIA